MIFVYRILFILIQPILVLLSPVLGAKMQTWMKLRDKDFSNLNVKDCYWFHASSGEIEYVKSVIIDLRIQQPGCQILVTYSSPSAEKLFENVKPYVNAFHPLPWDKPSLLRKFIEQIRPKILIFSRTDFWPELIYQTAKMNVPIGAASFYGSNSNLNLIYTQWLYKKFRFISCVDKGTAAALASRLSNVQITVDGDTRFDQVFWRLEQESKVNIFTGKKIFIAGSTWTEDELQLVAFFEELIKSNYQVIWSPHEVSIANVSRIVEFLKERQYSYQLLSGEDKNHLVFTADFLIVDQIGYLADLYRFAEFAFVGGSFKEKVHSVMEPLCCGLPVIVGPHFKNNPEAVKYSQTENQKFIYVCKTADEIRLAAKEILNQLADLQAQIKFEMRQNRNASAMISQAILRNVQEK